MSEGLSLPEEITDVFYVSFIGYLVSDQGIDTPVYDIPSDA